MAKKDKTNNTYGFIETRGLTAILYAIDNMLKGSSVKLIGFKRYGSAYLTAAIEGSTDDVINAIKIGEQAVYSIRDNTRTDILNEGLSQIMATRTISRPRVDLLDIFFNNPTGIRNTIDKQAIGFIDARGLISLVSAADQITKAYPIQVLGYQKMGSGRLNLVITGQISAIKDALEIGIAVVKKHGKLIGYSIIANPHSELKKMLQ